MKIAIIGLTRLHQTITLKNLALELENEIEETALNLDESLVDLALRLNKDPHRITFISNFCSAPLSIYALKKLEKEKAIHLIPDFKEKVAQDITIVTPENTHYLYEEPSLTLSLFKKANLEKNDYVITNIQHYEVLSAINNETDAKIILLDHIPMFRSLSFVEGIVLSSIPDNYDETIQSLIRSGLSWIAVQHEEAIAFFTLRHQFLLNIRTINEFLTQFFKALELNAITDWLDATRILG